jgi:hypothetical protein
VVKSFPYRDNPNEEFSNTYHFVSPPPGDDPSWMVVLNDVVAAEVAISPADTKVVRAYGYDSDDPNAHHVFAHDFTVPGPPPNGTHAGPAGAFRMAGDQAAMIWWKTSRLSVKGKPVYLRKYWHNGWISSTISADAIDGSWHTDLINYATVINTIHGGLRSRTHPDGVVAHSASQWVTTRTLKRRGKRPLTHP